MFASEEHNREPFKKVKKSKLDQIKDVVSTYLQKRNYPTQDSNNTSITAKEFMVASLIDNGISRPNSILYSCLNNDPVMIEQSFVKFVSWTKDLVKTKSGCNDLENLIGPLLCHLYFEILRGGHIDRANNFVKTHLSVVDKNKCDKIVVDIITRFEKEDVDLHTVKQNFRSNKFTIQLNTESVTVLRKYLEGSHIVLLDVLQNWFIIEEMMEHVEEEMDRTACGISDIPDRTSSNCSIQKLLRIINSVKAIPKSIYTVNIKNVEDEVTCGILSRNHGLMAYSYNNCVAVRTLNSLEQLQGCVSLGEVILIGHSSRVYDIKVFNNYLVSASNDKTIRLYNLNDHTQKMVYFGHDYSVYCLCTSQNNEFFVSGSYDRTARLWSVSRNDTLRLFIGHTQAVTSLDFHPNSNYIISGSVDQNIKMWSISNGEPVRSFPGSAGTIYAVRFSPDGKYLFSTGEDTKLRIWDLQAGKELVNISVGEHCNTKLAISTNESQVAVGSINGSVRIWDFKKLINEGSAVQINSIRLPPKLLALDYCYKSFGCLSNYDN